METQVLIIGAGVTGTGLARDLALRGVTSIVVEKRDVNAGASGGNHGLLHSGARYIASDPAAAHECHLENHILKKMMPHLIEETNGLFVAVAGDNENYIADFEAACKRSGISARPLDLKEAKEMEPALSGRLIAAFEVDDATIDALLPRVRNAGAIFLGEDAPVALGDYASGTNHVLPTGGMARRYSALNVLEFLKIIPITRASKEGLVNIKDVVSKLARHEKLFVHARSVEERVDDIDKSRKIK